MMTSQGHSLKKEGIDYGISYLPCERQIHSPGEAAKTWEE